MTELVIVSAADDAALVAELNRIVGFLDRVPDARLRDVAYTCSLARGKSVLAVIAADIPSLRSRLASAASRIASPTLKRIRDKSGTYFFREHLIGENGAKLAFVYPGVMGFYPDMLKDLAIEYPECRGAFDELEEALAGDPDFSPSSFIYPPAPYYRRDADIFRSGAYAQALVSTYAACVALTRLLKKVGVSPDGVVGFAGGDLAAMMCSGGAGEKPSRPDRIRVIREIYSVVNKAVNHGGLKEVAMITLVMRRAGEADEVLASFPKDLLTLAVDFSPRQKTYAVAVESADEVLAAFAAAGIRAMRLALDRPFNTPMCESLVPAIKKFTKNWMKERSTIDVWSCASARKVHHRVSPARDDTAGRWSKAVRFGDTIAAMHDDGYRTFVEVGPRGLMTAAVDDALKGREYAAIALNSIHRSGRLQLQHALGLLSALGQPLETSAVYEKGKVKALDFDATISSEVRVNSEKLLSRRFPALTLLSDAGSIGSMTSAFAEPKGRGAKAAQRAAVQREQARKQRQFDFGAVNPLVSDADTLSASPGVSVEIRKEFRIADLPFIADSAIGTSQLSYSDPNLRGLIPLTMATAVELAAETASLVMPNKRIVRLENIHCRHMVYFEKGALTLFLKAERVPSSSPSEYSVKVLFREDRPGGEYTDPVFEATVVSADGELLPKAVSVEALARPRTVHWTGRDIYPLRLYCGRRLRGIAAVESWSESGIDYEVRVPPLADNVVVTRFPAWSVNPILIGIVADGFALWRSHERFQGAFSFPFRLRRLTLAGTVPEEGSLLKCYMRLTGVTKMSHISEITVSDGNGNELLKLSGWEELTERVPVAYRNLILQPASTYLTDDLAGDIVGNPISGVASAYVTDIPYQVFARNGELWLKTLADIVLDASERQEFSEMPGSTDRRTEWLFGRVAAKEAVRKYLRDRYQARWSDADIRIWPDDAGKPHALGEWHDYLKESVDIAIAHTAQFVVAVAAANVRAGVDVENLNRDLSEEFTAGVFLPEELNLAAGAANASYAVIKFWCAKEAVSKSLGTGIRYSPREMNIVAFEADTGRVKVRLNGAWVEEFKRFRGLDIDVCVRSFREHAIATCYIPSALFRED